MSERETELETRVEAALAVLLEPVRGLHTEASWKYIYIAKMNSAIKILEGAKND